MKRAKKSKTRSHVPSVSLLSQKTKNQFCIAVEEDMGAFGYIWFPPVKADELEAYWARQPAAGMDGLKQLLGGEWIGSNDYCNSNSARRQFRKLRRRLHIPGRYYAHICCDSDSYLQAPEGRLIFHRGCVEDFRINEAPSIEEKFHAWKIGFFKGRLKKNKATSSMTSS